MKRTISERHKVISDKLQKHDAKRKQLEGQLAALQHECGHPNVKIWHDSGWGRMESTESLCPDCGLRTSR